MYLAFLFLLLNLSNFASADEGQLAYQDGIRAYQNSNFEEASNKFRSAYNLNPENKYILYNWGLSEFKLERKGLALGAWRKALSEDPLYEPARRAILFAQGKMAEPNHSLGDNTWEWLRNGFLQYVPLNISVGLSFVFFCFASFYLLRFFASNKKARDENLPSPTFPVGGVVFALMFVGIFGLSLAKAFDNFQPRATIIVASSQLRSGPGEDFNELFELYEGYEVLIRSQEKQWAQVKFPGGLTGWVPKKDLFVNHGAVSW